MTLSDEDFFDLNYLDEVLKVLNSDSPNLLVVSAKNKPKFMRRKKTRKIPLHRLKGETSYISGLIYKTTPVKEKLSFFRNLSKSEEFAFLYPAVLVAFALSLDGKCLRFKESGIKTGDILETTITSSSGAEYYLPTERVYQYISLVNCLGYLDSEYVHNSWKIKVIRLAAKLNFFGTIYDAVGMDKIRLVLSVDFLLLSINFQSPYLLTRIPF
jgi:hypothetical protein